MGTDGLEISRTFFGGERQMVFPTCCTFRRHKAPPLVGIRRRTTPLYCPVLPCSCIPKSSIESLHVARYNNIIIFRVG